MRAGIGYDVHRLVKDRRLFLAGVEVPYAKGLLGHSDGDIVMHSIADAILGALALGDIGTHFPNTDPQYKDISSGELVKTVVALAAEKGFIVNNVDTMILAEDPKLYPFRERMVEALAKVLSVNKDRVSVKATTGEGVGSIGKGEAMAAYAVVTLEEKR
ncbi:MAG: 2-C-methyl-D-erythritol 2,4-cyclodiphosphate synthase [Candidatus Omnitrophota bacterium]